MIALRRPRDGDKIRLTGSLHCFQAFFTAETSSKENCSYIWQTVKVSLSGRTFQTNLRNLCAGGQPRNTARFRRKLREYWSRLFMARVCRPAAWIDGIIQPSRAAGRPIRRSGAVQRTFRISRPAVRKRNSGKISVIDNAACFNWQRFSFSAGILLIFS